MRIRSNGWEEEECRTEEEGKGGEEMLVVGVETVEGEV